MLSGMSSTATTFLNMTNTTLSPMILQVADNSDNHAVRNLGLATILLIGIAIFCLRRPTPLNPFGRDHTQRAPAESDTEETPLMTSFKTPHKQTLSLPIGDANETLQEKINSLTDRVKGHVDMEAAVEIIEMTDLDLTTFNLTMPGSDSSKHYKPF